jgi:hypothetical protein
VNLGTFTINEVSEKTLTLSAVLVASSYSNFQISKITGTLTRTDGTSWLDSGFLEGQLIQVRQSDGLTPLAGCVDVNGDGSKCLFKIEMITGTDSQKTNKISLTSTTLGGAYAPDQLPAANPGTNLAVVQYAWVAYFEAPTAGNPPQTCPVADCGSWYKALTIPLLADPFFELAPGRQNLTTFPKQPHLLSGIRGPLGVEGGTTAADRSIHGAVLLPGEDNRPAFRVAAQPPEWQQIDTLNIYDDGSKEDVKGNLTSTALTGLNMGAGLDFTLLCGGPCPFNEPGKYPGGISYGSVSLDPITQNFTTDGTLSTIEVVNIMLGAGNDTLTIQSTLQPGGDFNPITALRGELAHHGGVTAVHGGGNALLRVDGTFELTPASGPPAGTVAKLVRQDGLSWQRYGFQVGQQVTLANGVSYTVTGFSDGPYGFGDTMFLGGAPAPAPPTFTGTATFTRDTVNGDTITASFNWQTAGFAKNQAITVTGTGVVNGVYHIAAFIGTNTIRLAEKGAIGDTTHTVFTVAASILGDLSGQMAVSDSLSVTATFTLSSNGLLLSNGQSWQSLGFRPALGSFSSGLQPTVFIPGYGVRTIVGYGNGVDAGGLPLDGGLLLLDGTGPAVPVQLTTTVSLTNRYRVNNVALTLTGSATGGTVTLPVGTVANAGLAVGQQLQISGVNGTRTITAINGDTVTVTDGSIGPIAPISTSGTVSLVRIGGDTITLTGPSYLGTLTTNAVAGTIMRATTATSDWIKDGFANGQQITLGGGVTGVYTITSVTATTLTVAGGTLAGGVFANSTVTVLPVGAGPGQPYDNYAPLVIYGDTSQDGVWYGGDPHTQSLHNFGPKPMPHVESLPVVLYRTGPEDGGKGYTGTISMETGVSVTANFNIRPVGYTTGSHIFNLTLTTIARTDGGSFVTDGFAIGQMIGVTGDANATFQVANVTAATLTLTPIAGSLPNGATNASLTIQTLSAFTITTTSGTWDPAFVAGKTIDVSLDAGGTFKISSATPTKLTLEPIGLSTLPNVNGAHLTVKLLNLGSSNSSGSFLTDGFAVGQELALGPATSPATSCPAAVCLTYDIWENHLTLHGNADNSWKHLGFLVGQVVTIDPYKPSTWTVKGFSGIGDSELELNGPQLDPLPNVSFEVKAVLQYVGIVKAVTKTQITLNLALTVADFPSGPLFPAAKGASPVHVVDDVKVLNRVGNSAPFFVFPLANPYLRSGNDVIDAHLLDLVDQTTIGPPALRPIGLTIYGGPGNDLIIGSQTGDQLAGGSGDDTILGQRGEDIIYGDSGFNVDLITRLLTVAVDGTGPAGYNPAKFVDLDHLVAGNDLLYGEGPGSATRMSIDTLGNDDDIIFGDLGVVTQDVSGARDVTKPLPPNPQALSTTIFSDQMSILRDRFGATPSNATAKNVTHGVVAIDSKQFQNAGNDWIYGNDDRDILIGGAGSDAIDGGVENDLILGDNVSMLRTYHDTTSPRFQLLCGSLLYSRSDETNPCTGTAPNADASGALLTNGVAQPYRDPIDTPWWAEYDVTNLWHDFAADNGLHWAGSFGNDYIAGGPDSDLVLGELGNDTVQGDGSVDFVSPGSPKNTFGGIPVIQRVGAFRATAVCTGAVNTICDPTGLLVTYPSVERATDGEDYIEGNGGNDVILGNLGQDDLVGGSSDYFSLADQTITISGLAGTWRVVGVAGGVLTVVGTTLPNDAVGTSRTIALVANALTITGKVTLAGSPTGGTITRAQFDWPLVGFSSSGANMRPDGGDYSPVNGSPIPNGTGDVGRDTIYGGAGTQIGIDNVVGDFKSDGTAAALLADATLVKDMHARDSDSIVGDNGDIIRIVGLGGAGGGDVAGCTDKSCETLLNDRTRLRYITYNFDNYDSSVTTSYSANGKIVVRGVTLLDYTIGGPDFRPDLFGLSTSGTCSTSPATGACGTSIPTCHGTNFNSGNGTFNNIGGADEVHGESGDDFVYTGCGSDVVFGDAQNDQIIAGWGADWVSGGTGQDGVLGDDGRIFESRNESSGVTWSENYGIGRGSWVNSCIGNGTFGCLAEPLHGVQALIPVDPDTKFSDGNVLNEFIYTPGMVQTSTINVVDQLAMAFDITPFNETPNALGADQPLFDANNEDDVIFGGWDGDFLHGASGDDAISGAEAATTSYVQTIDASGNPTGLTQTDWYHPFNPADILHFGADSNAWHSNHHTAGRLGEFLLYDEYDPRRAIEFNLDGSVWKGTVQTPYKYFLINNAADGRIVNACIAVDNQGNCTLHSLDPTSTVTVWSDGPDAIFGDLGNDYLLGGTGTDTLWAGWGNDLLNADDDLTTGCVLYLQNGHCDASGFSALNDVPDGVNSSYQDRAFGGAGLDILIGNTGGDRLIDWVGEFNTYLVPFAPFGIATVSRQNDPWLPEFLYALSKSQGADPTRTADTGNDPARNGEPDGELGLVRQQDHGLWQQQTGGPTDPQAGNIPGGRRDTLRGVDFNDGSLQGFAVDSGSWTVANGQLQVGAGSLGQDATAVYYIDKYLPIFYEIVASISTQKPIQGWSSNSFVLFDYWSPTDFKFAGFDVATNKMVIGHRNAAGWFYDAQSPFNGSLKEDTLYQLTVDVNGTVVTVFVNNQSFGYTFGPRTLSDGTTVGLNKGLVGFGSNNSRGVMDNIAVQALPAGNTLDTTKYFEDGTPEQFTGPSSGAWTQSSGRNVATAATNAYAVSTVDLGSTIQATSHVEVNATLNTSSIGGIAFDAYAANDFKFAALDVAGQRIVLGHVDPHRGWVVQTSFAATLVAGTDYVLDVSLKDTVATVSLNGNVLGSWVYNAATADGQVGVLTRSGTSSFDRFQIQTDDSAFAGSPPQPPELRIGDASVTEGNSGQKAVTLTLSMASASTSAASVNWTTANGTGTAGTDYVASSGTVTFAAGATSATVTVYVLGETTFEPNETFKVLLSNPVGLNIADGTGVVTVVNDDAQAAGRTVSIGSLTVTEADMKTTTYSVPVTLSSASTTPVTVTVTTVAGTATAGADFVSKAQTLTFNPGVMSLTFSFEIVNDKVAEPVQTFTLVLSNATGATIGNTGTVTIIDNDGALFAALSAPTGTTSATTLTQSALAPVVARAKALWRAALPGVSFAGITFTIGDLPGNLLGFTLGKEITIDATAAGWGWSVMDSGAASRMNLLTVVLHELGLALGFAEDDPMQPAIMARTLAPGVETVPALLPLIVTARAGMIWHGALRAAHSHGFPKLKLKATAAHPRGKVTHRAKGGVKA